MEIQLKVVGQIRRAPICAGHMAGVKRRTGKRSEPMQNKNGGCLYIVAAVPEKKLRQTFYTFDYT